MWRERLSVSFRQEKILREDRRGSGGPIRATEEMRRLRGWDLDTFSFCGLRAYLMGMRWIPPAPGGQYGESEEYRCPGESAYGSEAGE